MGSGYIFLHRKLCDWEWYKDANTARLFIHLLLKANHKETKWRGMTIARGQVLTGRKQLASELGVGEQSIRTALDRLQLTSELTIQPTNRFSIITLCNYELYQDWKKFANQPANQPAPNKQPTTNQPLTTSNNDNNDKTPKNKKSTPVFNPNGKKKYEEWVYLDDKQLESVRAYYEKKGLGADEFWEAVRALDTWFNDNPKMRAKRSDDARTLKGWPLNEAIKRKQQLLRLSEQKRRMN